MGAGRLNILCAEALTLPPAERAELARALVASLDGPADAAAAQGWDEEVLRRLDEMDGGSAKLVDQEELRRRLRVALTPG